jgi:RNA polymerase sigma-70 factor, ECF subfamily
VLEVIYVVFNEGYPATAGDDWMRPALCEDAPRLGRILSELVPKEPEVHGLVALIEIQASRSKARVSRSGVPTRKTRNNNGRKILQAARSRTAGERAHPRQPGRDASVSFSILHKS